MKVRRIATQLQYSVIGMFALMSAFASPVMAQDDHSHLQAPQVQSQESRIRAGALVNEIRWVCIS